MAIRMEVNEILKPILHKRSGFLSRASFDLFGNFFALLGLFVGLAFSMVVLALIAWVKAEPSTFGDLVSMALHPVFFLVVAAVTLAMTSWFGSLGITFGRQFLKRDQKIRELEATAETDPLSGLCSRRSFIGALESELDRVRRTGRGNGTAGLVFIDIDHFKRVNDTYGHGAGDEVICQLSRFLEHECRPYDTVGRWGGEEFVVLTPQTTLDQTVRFAERIRAGIEASELKVDYQTIHYTISMGVASYDVYTETIDDFIQRADDALYKAKEGGRNRVVPAVRGGEART